MRSGTVKELSSLFKQWKKRAPIIELLCPFVEWDLTPRALGKRIVDNIVSWCIESKLYNAHMLSFRSCIGAVLAYVRKLKIKMSVWVTVSR